jgi:hypothetical protein
MLRQWYWQTRSRARLWSRAVTDVPAPFRSIVLSEQFRAGTRIAPITGDQPRRIHAAARWLFRAQDACEGGGVSYGYFPASPSRGWDVPYPETTGYIITSLIRCGSAAGWQEPIDRARRMAEWEALIQMPSGAVQGGKLAAPDQQTAATFNTGMVLDGWVSVLEQGASPAVANAAQRAADFLCADLDGRGLFRTNGAFVSADAIKLYNVLCAWALHRFGAMSGAARYREAAVRAVDGALRLQQANGWLAENCLSDSLRPLTHTIGYSAQGILEVGAAAGRDDHVAAARRIIDGVIPCIQPNGYLAGRIDAQWRPAVAWSCLTGSAQLAIVAFRLATLAGQARYRDAASRLLDALKPLQRLDSGEPGIDGALAGSHPIMGDYMSAGYPNWATKYLLDALMAQADADGVRWPVVGQGTAASVAP